MSEYKVKQIMDGPPNEWKGPHGVVWYIEVMVEGHEKPLSVGKKDPNSLKVGDTIYGDIVPTDYINDKFMPAAPPQTNQGTSQADKSFKRDVTTIPLDVYRIRANITGLPGTADVDPVEFWEGVRSDAEELLRLIENIRNAD